MSYVRLTEKRRYFPGESNIYAYPSDTDKNGDLLIRFEGDLNGSMKSEDFWELVVRAVEKTDVDNDIFWIVESAISDYYEYEKEMPHDKEDIPERMYDRKIR